MDYTSKQADKVALITGSARRIGAAIAVALHKAGFRVAIHCHHSLTEANRLVGELNTLRADSACAFQADLSSDGACVGLTAAVINWAGALNLLVNNASLFVKSEHGEFNAKDWQDLFRLNVQAPYELSMASHTALALVNGSIINITDIHAATPLKHYAVYCQTKAALLMQTKALAKEFAPDIRVNAVAPGAIAWPENANALDDAIRQKIIAKTPLRCHGDPDYIARAVLALVDNPFITGQVLNVDGGRSIG